MREARDVQRGEQCGDSGERSCLLTEGRLLHRRPLAQRLAWRANALASKQMTRMSRQHFNEIRELPCIGPFHGVPRHLEICSYPTLPAHRDASATG